MKVGSLVECIKKLQIGSYIPIETVENIPVVGKVYTIREIFEDLGVILITLEEISMGRNPYSNLEWGAPINYFREIEIPPNIEKEIEEILIEELELV